jgi:hypothetical protein
MRIRSHVQESCEVCDTKKPLLQAASIFPMNLFLNLHLYLTVGLLLQDPL